MPATVQRVQDTRYSPPSKSDMWSRISPGTTLTEKAFGDKREWPARALDSTPTSPIKTPCNNLLVLETIDSTEAGNRATSRDELVQHLPGIWRSLEICLDSLRDALPELVPDTGTIPIDATIPSNQLDLVPRILSAFDQEPVEDGIPHPAENLIGDALSERQEEVIEWLQSVITQGSDPCLAASVLRCIGRLKEENCPEWTYILAKKALKHPDVEVRDAAAQVLEMCGTAYAADLLREHDERVPWLREYIHRVVKQIEVG